MHKAGSIYAVLKEGRETMICCVSSPGPNAISVSLSPMGRYVMVGLASRRILLHPSTEHMVAQVFRLQQPHGGETSMRVSGFSLPSSSLSQSLHPYIDVFVVSLTFTIKCL